jgi:membrane peptidoglycan carboxypeptidase
MSDRYPPTRPTVRKLALLCLLAGVLIAGLMFPVVGGLGMASNRASDLFTQRSADLVDGDVPAVSTMVDAEGKPIAWLYVQRRWEVPTESIADTMKLAIVSIEDKRFAAHNGVDLQGTLTGLAGFLKGGTDTRGGSTIEQQYVKNFNLLVNAETDAERQAAVETTPARKLREIRMALALGKSLNKAEILTRYLNLVPFGNGAHGVQSAARTYFGVEASQLNWQQAALLAGLVQQTTALNPYTNPEGALERRNVVLDTMIENLPDRAEELRAAKQQPLGVLPQPASLPQGCIAAGDRAFFCEYALEYLARAGISKEDVARKGYLIKTTLDPKVQTSVKNAINAVADPALDSVASVMSVIRPGKDRHPVLAIANNRGYGLKLAAAAVHVGRRRRRFGVQDLHQRRGAGLRDGYQRPARRAAVLRRSGARRQRHPGLPAQDVVRQERRPLPQSVEHGRRVGVVAQHRLRPAHRAGGSRTHGGHGGAVGAAFLR